MAWAVWPSCFGAGLVVVAGVWASPGVGQSAPAGLTGPRVVDEAYAVPQVDAADEGHLAQPDDKDEADQPGSTAPPAAAAEPEVSAEDVEQHARAIEPVLVRAVAFDGVSGDLLTAEALENLSLYLIESKLGYIPAPAAAGVERYRLGQLTDDQGGPLRLGAQGLNAITQLVSQAYIDAGFAAVRVTIRRDALNRLRAPDSDQTLRVRVIEGRVGGLRSRSSMTGEEVTQGEHRVVRRHSILRPGDAVNIRAANRYLTFLNRHPRRQVDMTLSPAEGTDQVMLDYLVHQAKPWTVYAQASNTGTPQTAEWREQVGLIHYNLTHHDDILAASYVTGDFDATHAVSLSYDRPLADHPRWRWRLFGDWSRYDASEVGLPGADFRGETWGGGAEIKWNFLQYKDLFVDAVGGVQARHIETYNTLAALDGDAAFLLPYVGVQMERKRINSQVTARMTLETNVRSLTDTDDATVQQLGRTNADSDWVSVRYDASFSKFMDPWFYGPNPSLRRPSQIHELAASLRGQLVLGEQRVAPSFTSAIGGFNSVRGYPEVFDSGDNSIIGSLEYRYHLPRNLSPDPSVGELWGGPFRRRPTFRGGPTDWDLILRGFVDAGHVWSNDPLSFEGSSTLVGAGVGMELLLKQNLSLRADWGFALREESSASRTVTPGSSQVHVQITLLY